MKFLCAPYQHEFVAPDISPHCYGEFLLRSKSNGTRYLNAIQDEVFSEVEALIRLVLEDESTNATNSTAALHAVFGPLACDPGEDGATFSMNIFPACPYCGTHDMAAWYFGRPPETVDMPIPKVTHHHWRRLNAEEKDLAVRKSLRKLNN